jgi:chitodextrinase
MAWAGTTQTSISVRWNASTDDRGVAGYRLYRNGVPAGTTTATTYSVGGLVCGTSYTIGLTAYDAAGNESNRAFATGTTRTNSCSATPTPTPSPSATPTATPTVVAAASNADHPAPTAPAAPPAQRAVTPLASAKLLSGRRIELVVTRPTRVTAKIRRKASGKVVRTAFRRTLGLGRHRLKLPVKGLKRGRYKLVLDAVSADGKQRISISFSVR